MKKNFILMVRRLLKNMDFKLSVHTQDMLKERNVPEEWVWRTINNFDWKNIGEDNNVHYSKVFQNMVNEFSMWR